MTTLHSHKLDDEYLKENLSKYLVVLNMLTADIVMEWNNNYIITVAIDRQWAACIAHCVTIYVYSLNIVNQWVTLIRWDIWCYMKSLSLGLEKKSCLYHSFDILWIRHSLCNEMRNKSTTMTIDNTLYSLQYDLSNKFTTNASSGVVDFQRLRTGGQGQQVFSASAN